MVPERPASFQPRRPAVSTRERRRSVDLVSRWGAGVLFLAGCSLVAAAAERPGRERPGPISPEAVRVLPADERGMATIYGRRGSVPPGRWVVVHTLDTDELVITRAEADGSFRLSAFAPAGAVLQVHHRRRRPPLPELDPDPSSSPALILELGPSPSSGGRDGDHRLSADAVMRHELARVVVHCRLSGVAVDPGETVRISGTMRLTPIEKAEIRAVPRWIQCDFELARLFAEDGGQVAPIRLLASAFLTPTGLPVEAPEDIPAIHCGGCRIAAREIRRREDVLRCRLATEVRLPSGLPAGYYLLGCRVHFEPGAFHSNHPAPGFFQEAQIFLPARLAILRVGRPGPPRLAVMLLPGLLSNGSRGVLPPEAERRWAVSPAAVFQTPLTFFPRRFPDGRPVPFRFEPGLPLVSLANRPFPLTIPRPLIPFRFPGGRWEVVVRSPSGKTMRLGPSAFVCGSNNLNVVDVAGANPAREPIEAPMAYGNNYLGDVYQISTARRREFVRTLDEDGRYTVETSGYVVDRFGHRYDLGGRFSFVVARPFDLDLGMFAGTPLVVGESIAPVVHVRPPLPADITMRVRHFPNSSKEREQVRVVKGRANRFGYFAPADPPVRLIQPGEYVVDVTASGRDEQGRLWMACSRGASVVAPRKPVVIAHGERGLRSPESTQRLAWYIEGLRRDVVRRPGAGMHALFPYHGGDVLWVEDHESIFPAVRFDDPTGRYADIIERLRPEVREGTYGGFFNHRLRPIDMRVVGELPLFSRAENGWPIGQFPKRPQYISYAYTSTVRPGVAVRSLVHESSFLAYWSLDDPFNLQYGVGGEGDLPGDIKLQFAGLVLRGPADAAVDRQPDFPQYDVYASMAVIVPPGDRLGNRVTPPLRGAAGGPNGGPLLTIRGRDYDMFVTPTGVLPGTVCEVGDRFTYSGYVWPTLPAEVSWTVTGPDRETRSFQTVASRVGYFHDPTTDFTLTEPGLYAHRVHLTYRGLTSAGPVAEPYPTGDLPGSQSGLSHFVVVDPREPPLEVEMSSSMPDDRSRLRRGTHVFKARVPAEWSQAEGWVTVWLPGFLIDDRRLAVSGRTIRYDFDTATWRRHFPNIDQQPVDTFVVTLSASGLDRHGRRRVRARLLVVQGPRVW